MVASSTAAVRVEQAGARPGLYFPCPDVRFELFRDEARRATCPVEGGARLWSIDGEPDAAAAGPCWGDTPGDGPAGHRRAVVLRRPRPGAGVAVGVRGVHAPGRRTVSAHMVFLRPADANRPLDLALDEHSAGRTFTTLGVAVGQDGRRCATGMVLAGVTAPDVMRHAVAPPDVPGPGESEPYDMGATGRDCASWRGRARSRKPRSTHCRVRLLW